MNVLPYTYQDSKNLEEVNTQVSILVEKIKKQFLLCASKEAADEITLKVEQVAADGQKRMSYIEMDVDEHEAKISLVADFDTAHGSLTITSAMVNGIQQSNIYLSGDQIHLDGETYIGSGFTLHADHIQAGTITATQIAGGTITGAKIANSTITGANIAANTITASNIDVDTLSVQLLVNRYASMITFGSGIYIPSTYGYYTQIDSNGLDAGMVCVDALYSNNNSFIAVFDSLSLRAMLYANSGIDVGGTATFDSTVEMDGTVYSRGIYNNTMSSSPNVTISANEMGYSSGSSRRWKHDIKPIENAEIDPERLYNIPVVQFVYNDDYLKPTDQRHEKNIPGFIAEDIQEIYPIACDLEEDGKAHDWNLRYIVPPMLKLIQDQNERIKGLEATVYGR